MNLSRAVEAYVRSKRARGCAFDRGCGTLRSFDRHAGDVPVCALNGGQVLHFLNQADVCTATWRLKYDVLRNFLEFWTDREGVPRIEMPPIKPRIRQLFTPYIYGRRELKSLITTSPSCGRRLDTIDGRTLQAIILFLYGTGASVGEAVCLRREDINLEDAWMVVGRGNRRCRQIPIGTDMLLVLQTFLALRSGPAASSCLLFAAVDGKQIVTRNLNKQFERLRSTTGVLRHDGATYQPRLLDLRFTFVVHRITSWIESGSNLNKMLPALCAYLGQVGTETAERYIAMVPERFSMQLKQLSPTSRVDLLSYQTDRQAFVPNRRL